MSYSILIKKLRYLHHDIGNHTVVIMLSELDSHSPWFIQLLQRACVCGRGSSNRYYIRPLENVSYIVSHSSCGPVKTPGVFQKFDELEMQWSVHNGRNLNDGCGELSLPWMNPKRNLSCPSRSSLEVQREPKGNMNSGDERSPESRPWQGIITSTTEGRVIHGRGTAGESVCDRLCNHARAKQAETTQSVPCSRGLALPNLNRRAHASSR
jgi:hypothetical protein